MSQLSAFLCDCIVCRVAILTLCPCSADDPGLDVCNLTHICGVPKDIWDECVANGEAFIAVMTNVEDGGEEGFVGDEGEGEEEGEEEKDRGYCCYRLTCSDIECPPDAPYWNDLVITQIGSCESPFCCDEDPGPCQNPDDCCKGNRPDTVKYKLKYNVFFSRRSDVLGQMSPGPCGQEAWCNNPSYIGGPFFCHGAPALDPPYPYWGNSNLRAKAPHSSCSPGQPPEAAKWKCIPVQCDNCGQIEGCEQCGAPPTGGSNIPAQVGSDGRYGIVEYDMVSPPMLFQDCENIEDANGWTYVKANYEGYGICRLPVTFIKHQCIGMSDQNATSTPSVPGCGQGNGWRRMGCSQPAGPCPGCTPVGPGGLLRSPNDALANETTTTVDVLGSWFCSISVNYGLNNYCLGGRVIQTVRFIPDPDEEYGDEWFHEIIWNVPDGVDATQGCNGISEIYDPVQEWMDWNGQITRQQGEQLFDYYGYSEMVNAFAEDYPHGASLDNGFGPFGCGSVVGPNTPIVSLAPATRYGNTVGPNYMYIDYGASNLAYGRNASYDCGEHFEGSDGAIWYKKAFAAGVV